MNISFYWSNLFFFIVAVKRSDTFRPQTLSKPEISMSMAEQNEMINKCFCAVAIRASKSFSAL
jgi:hypothetical protein